MGSIPWGWFIIAFALGTFLGGTLLSKLGVGSKS